MSLTRNSVIHQKYLTLNRINPEKLQATNQINS